MGTNEDQKVDARGVPIELGATVIYGAPVGRSIALVEGVVDGFTDSGRAWVRITRRAYGGGWAGGKDRVHVGADRIAQVVQLPDSTLPTEREARVQKLEKAIARYRGAITKLEAGETDGAYASLETYQRWLATSEADLAKLEAVAA